MVQTVIYTSPMWYGFDMDATVGVNWVAPTSPTQGLNHADSHMTTPIWACLSLTLCCRGRPSITAPRPLRWTEVTELRRGDEVPVSGGWGGQLRGWASFFFFFTSQLDICKAWQHGQFRSWKCKSTVSCSMSCMLCMSGTFRVACFKATKAG